MIKKIHFLFVLWMILSIPISMGQNDVLSLGGTARIPQGEVSYSVGQAVITSCEWDVVRVNGGVQQVFCQPTDSSFSVQASNSFVWNGNRIDRSGLYCDTLVNRMGCDSIVKMNLTLISAPLPRIVSYDRKVVMVNHYPEGVESGYVDYGRYRWYRNGALMSDGPNDKFFEEGYTILEGIYHVEVPSDDTGERWVYSNLLDMSTMSIEDGIDDQFVIIISPNPVTSGEKISILLPEKEKCYQMRMYDQSGRLLERRKLYGGVSTMSISYPIGIYSIQFESEDGRKGITRIVVE